MQSFSVDPNAKPIASIEKLNDFSGVIASAVIDVLKRIAQLHRVGSEQARAGSTRTIFSGQR
jgi:hypothetical protein